MLSKSISFVYWFLNNMISLLFIFILTHVCLNQAELNYKYFFPKTSWSTYQSTNKQVVQILSNTAFLFPHTVTLKHCHTSAFSALETKTEQLPIWIKRNKHFRTCFPLSLQPRLTIMLFKSSLYTLMLFCVCMSELNSNPRLHVHYDGTMLSNQNILHVLCISLQTLQLYVFSIFVKPVALQ